MIEHMLALGGILARPLQHGSGLDELACLVLPMVLLGVFFLVIMRKSNQVQAEDSPVDDHSAEPDDRREPGREE